MNAMVASGAAAIGNAGVNWLADTIKACLADASFVPTYDTHGNINNANFLSDIQSSLVGTAVVLTGKTNVAGILGAANPTFPAVSGNTVVRVWAWKDTGVAGTSQLLLQYDTGSGLPLVPTGGDVSLYWDTGAITGVAGVVII